MENEDYKLRFECAAELMHLIIRESNEKNEIISHLKTEIRELKEQLYEIRYNPYHDPENGRLASGKGVDISGGSGIINIEVKQKMELTIDKFTPCLENTNTGEIVPTVYEKATKVDLASLSGWKFNWLDNDLKNAEIYKLRVAGDDCIQGLVALTDFERDKAIYVNLAESAPHNMGCNKKYSGVGGHLFAIAADILILSISLDTFSTQNPKALGKSSLRNGTNIHGA